MLNPKVRGNYTEAEFVLWLGNSAAKNIVNMAFVLSRVLCCYALGLHSYLMLPLDRFFVPCEENEMSKVSQQSVFPLSVPSSGCVSPVRRVGPGIYLPSSSRARSNSQTWKYRWLLFSSMYCTFFSILKWSRYLGNFGTLVWNNWFK